VLRFRNNVPLARFSAPGGVAVAVAATALSVWLLSNSPSNDARAAVCAAALGLMIFFFWGKPRKADPYRALPQANTEKSKE
jgi:putative flippase GtrA